ncbi:hypothetical protein [Chryseobacterium sp. 5_R23647]|uniref:hypothetical protein n=1 Tax=Chryseobacterium sp. 5_R23647 TaxID=2258964 RepID=UPI000E242856|nr:hypothetical protein [Chryseobacterium sp. 5_R23647]REC42068.1 hypothetical protein DRF69_12980 [Chryseobacterium sp. 5_R23647]
MEKILDCFIDYIQKHKKLEFKIDEIAIDNSLVERGILKIENNMISISDYAAISKCILEKHRFKLDFKISGSFEKTVEFLDIIKQDYNSNVYIFNYHLIEKENWRYLVKESFDNYNCTFSEYLKSVDIEKKPEGIYQFIHAYSDLLPDLSLSADEIVDNFLLMVEMTKSNAEYNIDLGNIITGVKNKCKLDYETGLRILNTSLTLEKKNDYLTSAAVTGLYESKSAEFYYSTLEKLLNQNSNCNSILLGLSHVSVITDDDCTLFIEIINRYKQDELVRISILSLLFSILRSNHKSYHQFCFLEIGTMTVDEKAAYFILHNICFINSYNREKSEVVNQLVCQKYFTIDKYIQPISQIFWYIKDIESFKTVILAIIQICPFKNFMRKFQSFLHSVDKVELDTFLIELLTDNSAGKRFTGMDIFHELSLQKPYVFSVDILLLPTIIQYKLWVTLTGDFNQPNERLTALMPLIDAKSDLIRESFICKLEVISEDYGGHVTDVLESSLDSSNLAHNAVLSRIKNYICDFYDQNTSFKNTLNEFNPYQTHSKLINKYNDFFHKHMRETIDQGAKKDSLLSLLGTNTVQLSKGGGWRLAPDKEITQLSSFGSSFTMPRTYFIHPNQFDMEKGMIILNDWKDQEFADIIKIIENEQH